MTTTFKKVTPRFVGETSAIGLRNQPCTNEEQLDFARYMA
jgi:hypothetical protein